jgi:hypothetical protein
MPPVDGVSLNTGDIFLLVDGTSFAGLYRVDNAGAPTFGWFARAELTQPAAGDTINVAEGSANAGLWNCTGAGAFSQPGTAAQNLPKFKVTIEYRALELSFEYVAKTFASLTRWLQGEYTLTNRGYVIINDATGVGMLLQIDSVRAIQIIATDDGNGNITLTDGPEVAVSAGQRFIPQQRISLIPVTVIAADTGVIWQNSVKFVGDAAQFEQIPAGAAWHVKETTTVKIVPIIPAGNVVAPP